MRVRRSERWGLCRIMALVNRLRKRTDKEKGITDIFCAKCSIELAQGREECFYELCLAVGKIRMTFREIISDIGKVPVSVVRFVHEICVGDCCQKRISTVRDGEPVYVLENGFCGFQNEHLCMKMGNRQCFGIYDTGDEFICNRSRGGEDKPVESRAIHCDMRGCFNIFNLHSRVDCASETGDGVSQRAHQRLESAFYIDKARCALVNPCPEPGGGDGVAQGAKFPRHKRFPDDTPRAHAP